MWVVESLAQAQTVAVQTLLDRLRPSVAVLGSAQRPTGSATLLDADRGLFLAHADAIQGDTVQARIGSLGRFRLKVVARDERTNLVLLGPGNDLPRLTGPTINVADASPVPNTPIVVLLADGGIGGSFVGGQSLLVQSESRRAVPASELRFETPLQLVAGALVLTLDGRLVGTMGATIARAGNVAPVTPGALADVRSMVQGQSGGALGSPFFRKGASYGPQGMTVAYTPNLTAIQRTIAGFLSRDHQPEYAGLGLQVAESPIGLVVVRVFPESPASRIKIQVGDTLLSMDSRPVQRQYDFLQILLMARPGDHMTIRLRHEGTEITREAVLAKTKR